jgi:CubicO group peptidase (beta-lactamase class C family)
MTIRRLAPALCLAAGYAWGQADPVFSPTGPDAAAYGHEQNYPYGPPAGELVPLFMGGTLTHFDRIFPHHVVARDVAAPLPRAAEELALTYRHDGMVLSLADYLRRNPTTSLLVARGGTILFEHYQYSRTDTDRFLSFSMAKTVTGMLIGIAVREGAIRSIDQPAADYVTELAGTEYGGTSIRNLLRMASGVAFRETYDGTDDATKLRVMQYSRGGPPGTHIVSSFNQREAPAGTRFHYASAETAVLGLVLRRAVNMPLAEYLSTRIWQPMGAEADATWGVDNSGVETAQCCLSAVARLAPTGDVAGGRRRAERAGNHSPCLGAGGDHPERTVPGAGRGSADLWIWLSDLVAARPGPPVRVDGPPRPGDLRGSEREAGVGAYGGTGAGDA